MKSVNLSNVFHGMPVVLSEGFGEMAHKVAIPVGSGRERLTAQQDDVEREYNFHLIEGDELKPWTTTYLASLHLPFVHPTAIDETAKRAIQKAMPSTILGWNGKRWNWGSDPEIFVVDESGNVIPAPEFLHGKDESVPLNSACNCAECRKGGRPKIFWDGFQAELTTRGNLHCLQLLGDDIQSGLKSILRAAQTKFPKARLSIKTVVPVSEAHLMTYPEAFVTFGCSPSMNAYEQHGEYIENPRLLPIRFAGGHIHMGFRGLVGEHFIDPVEVVKTLDATIGVASVAMFAGLEDCRIRRRFYGLAGEYRLPAHGLEYRTLSNAWLCHPAIYMMTFELARVGAALGVAGGRVLLDADEELVRTIINRGDVELARKYITRNETMFLALWRNAFQNYFNGGPFGEVNTRLGNQLVSLCMKATLEGATSLIAEPENLGRNWKLNGTWNTTFTGHNLYELAPAMAKAKI